MSTTTQTDLTTCTDTELDAALLILWRQHHDAEPHNRLEIHLAALDILAEQATRYEHLLSQEPPASDETNTPSPTPQSTRSQTSPAVG